MSAQKIFTLIGIGLVLTLLLAPPAAASETGWDKSSITLDGKCLADGQAEFSITNTGAAMAGPSAWRKYVRRACRRRQVSTGGRGSQIWTFVSNGEPIEFQADQRPGHPGSSAPKLTLTCTPYTVQTALTACVGDKAFVNWTAGNYWGSPYCSRSSWADRRLWCR